MSAFICTDATFNNLTAFYMAHSKSHYFNKAWQVKKDHEIASILSDENVRSVNYRYSEESPLGGFKYERPAHIISPIQALKLCGCVDYQSCETDDWETTEAFAILKAIRSEAIRKLPGYDAAQWDMAD